MLVARAALALRARWGPRRPLRPRPVASLAVLVACALSVVSVPARGEGHRTIALHAVWFEGIADDNRERLNEFFACLIEGSNIHSYWQGEAGLVFRGSFVVPPPPERLEADEVVGYLDERVAAGDLPTGRADETPLYVVFGGSPAMYVGGCGRALGGVAGGREVGVALVRNVELCWPTGDRLRTETQIAFHEVVEVTDALLGYAPCAADGTCEAQLGCEGACDTFVGLTCPGAPEGSFTGCGGRQIDGWVVQKLSYEGRLEANCQTCVHCGFVPRACATDEPDCSAVPPRPSSPPDVEVAGGCTTALRPAGWLPRITGWGAWLVALVLVWRRRRRA